VAGVIVLVPREHLGLPGARKGMIDQSKGAHTLAVLGWLKETVPEIARRERGNLPKKVRSQLLLTASVYPNPNEPFYIKSNRSLLMSMARVPRANAIIITKEGYQFTPDKRGIIPVPGSRR